MNRIEQIKKIIFKPLLLIWILHSCTEQREQVYISNYNISVNGEYSTETSLFLIHLKNDSLFYFNSEAVLLYPYYLGKLKSNQLESKLNDLNIEHQNDSLKLYDNDLIWHFKELKEKTINSVSVNKNYFIGKKFTANTKYGNLIIQFIDEKRGSNLTHNCLFEWDLIEFEGYYFLWSVSDIERVPLFIKNITSDTIYTQLFTKEEVLDIIFTKIN